MVRQASKLILPLWLHERRGQGETLSDRPLDVVMEGIEPLTFGPRIVRVKARTHDLGAEPGRRFELYFTTRGNYAA